MGTIDDFLYQLNEKMAGDLKPSETPPETPPEILDGTIDDDTTPTQMREQVLLMIQDVLETSVAAGKDGPHGIIVLTVADSNYRKWAYGLTCAQMVGFLELYKASVITDWLT